MSTRRPDDQVASGPRPTSPPPGRRTLWWLLAAATVPWLVAALVLTRWTS